MFKKGFTLAEVLITLMIIGVVATLTTPALVKNVGSSKIGPQLSKFVNTWETAAETMLMEENVSRLSDALNYTNITDNNSLGVLSKYIIMTNLKNVTTPTSLEIKNNTGSATIETFKFSDGRTYQLKDGTILGLIAPGGGAGLGYGSSYPPLKGSIGTVIVDIGGLKGSHRAGKEVFRFLIDDNGTLVPYGSNMHCAIESSICKVSCQQGSDTGAWNCTGAVADNGWKAPW